MRLGSLPAAISVSFDLIVALKISNLKQQISAWFAATDNLGYHPLFQKARTNTRLKKCFS